MNSKKNEYDNLTVIMGIGPARQQWLRESLNVRTYQDLVALSTAQIESQLKADGQIASRNAIEGWLAQAKEYATSNRANLPTREDGWKPVASFVVEFQTREVEGAADKLRTAVHYMEEDTGTYWPSIESRKLCEWMLDQIRDKVGREPEDQRPTPAQPTVAPQPHMPSAKVGIRQLRIFQPPKSETPTQSIEAGKSLEGSVNGDEPFTLEVDFEFTGPGAADIAGKKIECSARSYAYDETKNTSIHLGDTGPKTFKEKKTAYTVALPEATLKQGRYRLWILVTPIETTLAVPDYIEVPELRVV